MSGLLQFYYQNIKFVVVTQKMPKANWQACLSSRRRFSALELLMLIIFMENFTADNLKFIRGSTISIHPFYRPNLVMSFLIKILSVQVKIAHFVSFLYFVYLHPFYFYTLKLVG